MLACYWHGDKGEPSCCLGDRDRFRVFDETRFGVEIDHWGQEETFGLTVGVAEMKSMREMRNIDCVRGICPPGSCLLITRVQIVTKWIFGNLLIFSINTFKDRFLLRFGLLSWGPMAEHRRSSKMEGAGCLTQVSMSSYCRIAVLSCLNARRRAAFESRSRGGDRSGGKGAGGADEATRGPLSG